MDTGKALVAGLIAGIAGTILLALGRVIGIPINIGMLLGTMLGLAPGPSTWFVGFIIHLVVSAVLGILYASGFEYLTHRSGAGIGIGFSILHILVAGLVMGAIPMLHPMIPEVMAAPGVFLANLGAAAVVMFLILHLAFGAIVGAMYRPVLHPRTARGGERHAHA